MSKSTSRKGVREAERQPFVAGADAVDLSDIPELGKAWFDKAVLQTPLTKQAISLRVDQHVLTYFKEQGKGYQTMMNAVLRAYVEEARRKARAAQAKSGRKGR